MEQIDYLKYDMTVFLLVDISVRAHKERVDGILAEIQSILSESAASEEDMELAVKTYYFKELTRVYTILKNKLSFRADCANDGKRICTPVIILISDGKQVESISEYQCACDALKANNWFKAAVKLAISIEDVNCENSVLTNFTGTREAILTFQNVSELKKLIRFCRISATGGLCSVNVEPNETIWDEW